MRVNLEITNGQVTIPGDQEYLKDIVINANTTNINVGSYSEIFGKILSWLGYAVKVEIGHSKFKYLNINSLSKHILAASSEKMGISLDTDNKLKSEIFNRCKGSVKYYTRNSQALSMTQLNKVYDSTIQSIIDVNTITGKFLRFQLSLD